MDGPHALTKGPAVGTLYRDPCSPRARFEVLDSDPVSRTAVVRIRGLSRDAAPEEILSWDEWDPRYAADPLVPLRARADSSLHAVRLRAVRAFRILCAEIADSLPVAEPGPADVHFVILATPRDSIDTERPYTAAAEMLERLVSLTRALGYVPRRATARDLTHSTVFSAAGARCRVGASISFGTPAAWRITVAAYPPGLLGAFAEAQRSLALSRHVAADLHTALERTGAFRELALACPQSEE